MEVSARTSLILRYAFFAAIAIVLNIAMQAAFLRFYSGPFAVVLSIGVGTIAGLAVKYLLDKTMIFNFEARDLRHDGVLFARYSLMGVATTLIFWGLEMAFHVAFGTDEMRYLG